MDQTQVIRYVSRFESLLYVSAFTHKNFHYVHIGPSTKGPPLRNYNSTLGVHYSSLKHNHLHTRGIGTKPNPNHNHLYTRGVGTKPNLNQNHLYTRGIGTKSNSTTITKAQPQSPLQKRDRHKDKAQP